MKPERGWVCFQGFPDRDVSTLTSACTAILQHKAYLTLTPDQKIKAGIPHLFLYIFLSILLPPRLFLVTLASGLRQLIFYFLKESKIKKKTQKTPQQFGFKFVFRNLSIWNFMFVFLPAFSFQLNSITFPLNTMVSKIKIFSIHLKMLMLIKVDQKTLFEIQQNQTEL